GFADGTYGDYGRAQDYGWTAPSSALVLRHPSGSCALQCYLLRCAPPGPVVGLGPSAHTEERARRHCSWPRSYLSSTTRRTYATLLLFICRKRVMTYPAP